MACTDHANAAAAVSAGYRKTQIDRGASVPATIPRYATIFDKAMTGASESGSRLEAMGESNSSAAAADTAGLAALNAQRQHHYGGSAGRASGSAESNNARGGVHTVDLT